MWSVVLFAPMGAFVLLGLYLGLKSWSEVRPEDAERHPGDW